jgi:hypothetical protein
MLATGAGSPFFVTFPGAQSVWRETTTSDSTSSPAATASLAYGNEIAMMATEYFNLK